MRPIPWRSWNPVIGKNLKSYQHGRCAGNQNACGVQDRGGRGTDKGSGVAVGGVESKNGWGGEKGQRLKLAEYAVVQAHGGAHDVAVMHMMQTRNTDNSSQA